MEQKRLSARFECEIAWPSAQINNSVDTHAKKVFVGGGFLQKASHKKERLCYMK